MSKSQTKSATGKIFDNILFLAEVFGDQAERDIPKLPRNVSTWKFPVRVAPAGAAAKLGRYGNKRR